MKMEKALVRENGMALLRCPHCMASKEVNVARLGNPRKLKVRCACGSPFQVFFEYRRAERKDTYIQGYYAKLPEHQDWSKILVKNLSRIGIGFVALTTPNVKSGDQIRITLTWDNADRSDIDKDATVKFVKEKYLGCEFHDPITSYEAYAHSIST